MSLQIVRSEEDRAEWTAKCERCNATVERYRGQDDVDCAKCGAIYNLFGQRLRDDLYSRPNYSECDEEIGDMEGFEVAMLRSEADHA